MNCTICGTALVPGALFCPNCGSRVTTPSSTGAPTAGLPPAYGEPGPPLSQPYDVAPPAVAPQWVAPGNAPYAVAGPPNSTAAVVSLVFGILTWVLLPVIGPIVAVVAGHMARAEIRRSNGQIGGGGMAIAGLVLGYLQLALLALAICAIVVIGILTMLGGRVTTR
jgi:Domain of unknown function (DUF4190)/zinc-ribbon domain